MPAHGLDLKLFASTFALIFVAELPDKTALATLLMAARGHGGAIFTGVAAAFAVQSLMAVAFGDALGLLPERVVHLAAGILFLAFAVAAWFRGDGDDKGGGANPAAGSSRRKFWGAAWRAFVVIFIAEWGDLTQLASASLVAKTRDPLTIFCAATASLWCATGLVIIVGTRLKRFLKADTIRQAGAAAFAAVGLYFIASWFR